MLGLRAVKKKEEEKENEVSFLGRFNIEAKRTVIANNLSRSKRKRIESEV